MLNENVKKYAELKAQADVLKEQMDSIREEIIAEMGDDKIFTADDGTVAKLVIKTTIKYTDEQAMLKYLKDNNLTSYIVEKVNTTSMNNELKKGLSLTESLKSWYTNSVTYSLTVENK